MTSEASIDYDRTKELKEFDDTKAGVKGLVDAGIRNIPKIFVRPADDLVAEQLNYSPKSIDVPIIDLSNIGDDIRRKEIVNEVNIASTEWGFFHVMNHAIPLSVLDEMIDAIRLFNEQDLEMKQQMYSRDSAKNVQFNSNHDLYTSKTADWRDSLMLSSSGSDPDPSDMPATCRKPTMEYIKHMKRLAETLFELLSEALGLEPNHLGSIGCSDGCSIVAHYYPACPQPELALGLRKHADAGIMTLLLQNHISSLQVLHDGQWFDVHPARGSLVVNVGDLLQILSNDKFKSAVHRVTANHAGPRISVPCFFSGNASMLEKQIGPIKELISEANPARYKEFLLKEYIGKAISNSLDDKPPRDYYKLDRVQRRRSIREWFTTKRGKHCKNFSKQLQYQESPKSTKSIAISSSTNTGRTPSRRLTFTEIRKSLIGDVTLLQKVFRFLETWDLISFVAPPRYEEGFGVDGRVRVENGVRVVATPDLFGPLTTPIVKEKSSGDGFEESGIKLPPLASYSDVFGDLKRLCSGNSGDYCNSGYYEYTKDNFVLKDWNLVAHNVQTKSKLDCITKLVELPIGESLMDSAKGRGNSTGTSMNVNGLKPVLVPSSEHQESIVNKDQGNDNTNENGKDENFGKHEPPLKKNCTTSISDADSSLMKQVARISSMVAPQIIVGSAKAAVAMLSDEMTCPREIFDGDQMDLTNSLLSPALRARDIEEPKIKERSGPSGSQETPPKKSDVPLPLRIRTAVATGLGAAATHAKLLAVQEEREIEHLVATIIEAQLKKLHSKMKHCDDADC